MEKTELLKMPFLGAGQAQKHVKVNEALQVLDAVVQVSVKDKDLITAPGSPSEGDRYIVGDGATGAWSGQDGDIAAYQDGAWSFHAAVAGWRCWVIDEGRAYVWSGTAWLPAIVFTPNQAFTGLSILEEEVSVSGASTDTIIQIPDRAIVFCVSTRTTAAITGATSYDVGDGTTSDKFGGLLGVALDSTNSGVVGPTAYYADTSIRLTANGGNFSGGTVRVAIHYMICQVPQS